MKRLIVLLIFIVCLTNVMSVSSQGNPCDPAALIEKASVMKPAGDQQKDLAALMTLAHEIYAHNSACTVPADLGNRGNPVPIGQTIKLAAFTNHEIEMTLKAAYVGDPALLKLAEFKINGTPEAGNQFVFANIALNYLAGPENELFEPYSGHFKVFSKGQVFEKYLSVSNDKYRFYFSLFPGASVEGWVLLEIPAGDTAPLLIYMSEFSAKSYIYFSLAK